jgi:lysyl-tRNA synthetase class 2
LQEYYKLRLQTLQQLKDAGENPYPHKFHVSISLTSFIETYSHLKEGDILLDVSVSLAGRIHAIRESGVKLRFLDCRGEDVKLQIMANAKYFTAERDFEEALDRMRRGDIVGFIGHPAKTKKVLKTKDNNLKRIF